MENIFIETFNFSQGSNSACCPIAVILSRMLYEREVNEEDFKRSIHIGTLIWKSWTSKYEEQMMHFFNVKSVEPRLLYLGKHSKIIELYGKIFNIDNNLKELGFNTLMHSINKLDGYEKFSGVITCCLISLCIGKRERMYFLCDSHLPNATIIKVKDKNNLYKLLLKKIGLENHMYEINVFV